MSASVYDRLYEVRYNRDKGRLCYLGPDRRWLPLSLVSLLTTELGGEVDVTITDTDGNAVDVQQVNGLRALVSSDDRTHRGLERMELLLIRILAALEGSEPEDIDPDPRE